MIVLKVATMVFLCYLFSRGILADCEKRIQREAENTDKVREAFQEYKLIIDEEKRVLVNTINELRTEVSLLKDKNGR